ncbi:MAG: HmuY family protein [Bacteroidota bacterium]|nr:HmuY family protein [Candidatus Kapabacteria bacterium]MCS7302973.1 HmuY family protein [Candidatus Kapabacteria bacterium]MDW8075887.1 HmuY family protein [Bacteroidota bacterium]MDW8272527.1 HmuY family protein [Bacteroidota bacterium]
MKRFLAVPIVAAVFLSSCKDNSTNEPTPTSLQVVVKTNLSPSAQDGWLYYSFDKDTAVNPSSKEGADWDIKFRYVPYDTSQAGIRYLVAVYTQLGPMFFNSGTVNPNGKTQAVLLSIPFDSVADATPYLSQLRNDDTSRTGRIVPVLGGGDLFGYTGPPRHAVTINPNMTFLVRTKSNRYVKFQLLSIYKDAPTTPDYRSETNYYTFRYVKGDGTRLR